jgi:Na+/melibiose symporter-like transporter
MHVFGCRSITDFREIRRERAASTTVQSCNLVTDLSEQMAENVTASESPASGPSLWRHADFLKLWSGQTVSLAGSQVTTLALPLTAVLVLRAGPLQMGVLQAAQFAPFIVVTLLAGVWVDRASRRTLLIGSDVGRALLLGSVPVAFLLGLRSIEYLYVVAFAVGILSVIFNVAYQAYLPTLVDVDQLAEGNSKLEASRSLTQVVGPGLGGLAVQAVSPPLAIVLDALSFVVSAISLRSIRRADPRPRLPAHSVWTELREGFAFIFAHPIVRPIVLTSALVNISYSLAIAVYLLFLSRDLHLGPALLGVVLAMGGAGGLAGAATARWPLRWLGYGRTVAGSIAFLGLGTLGLALAGILPVPPVLLVGFCEALTSYTIIVYNIGLFTISQTTTPNRLRGRVSAAVHFIIWGALPFGAVAGGALGAVASLRSAIAVAAAGVLVSAVWIALTVPNGVAGERAAEPAPSGVVE